MNLCVNIALNKKYAVAQSYGANLSCITNIIPATSLMRMSYQPDIHPPFEGFAASPG